MNKENVEKLIAALESGGYKQTRERLHTSLGYCCLGVACDLYLKENGGEWTEKSYGVYAMPMSSGEPNEYVMPDYVYKWYGFDTGNPTLPPGSHAEDPYMGMAGMNDDMNWDFPKIASVLRRALEIEV